MKTKFLKLFAYLRYLITNEHPESKSDIKKRKVVTEDNLRWQDDGGPVVDITKPIPPMEKDKVPQPTDAPVKA